MTDKEIEYGIQELVVRVRELEKAQWETDDRMFDLEWKVFPHKGERKRLKEIMKKNREILYDLQLPNKLVYRRFKKEYGFNIWYVMLRVNRLPYSVAKPILMLFRKMLLEIRKDEK